MCYCLVVFAGGGCGGGVGGVVFFFNDTATTEIYTLSLHDALPICTADRLEHRQNAGKFLTIAVVASHTDREC